jgi:hypothetical protein
VFQLFRTFVASVLSECCKSRLVLYMLQYDSPTARKPPCVTPQVGAWILVCTKQSRLGQALHTREKCENQSGISGARNGVAQGSLRLCKQIPTYAQASTRSSVRMHPMARHPGTSCPLNINFPSSRQNNIGLAQ